MSKFIRVTKDNRKKDRGFIAVDAICAVFENQEHHNTEIMTMDGFWYEVVDGVEKVYADVTGIKDVPKGAVLAEPLPIEEGWEENNKFKFAKRRRFVTPPVAEESIQRSHEETRVVRKGFSFAKKESRFKQREKERDLPAREFPSGEGKEQHVSKTMAEEFTPSELGEA